MTKLYDRYLKYKVEFDAIEEYTFDTMLNKVYALWPYFNTTALGNKIGVNTRSFAACRGRNRKHPVSIEILDALLSGMEKNIRINTNQSREKRWNFLKEHKKVYNLRAICSVNDLPYEKVHYALQQEFDKDEHLEYLIGLENTLKELMGK